MACRGKLFIISGPSGSGKSSLVNDVLKESDDFIRSVSVTTRPRREDENSGSHYHFISREKFDKLIEKDMLLEWASYAGYLYGTPKKSVLDNLKKGKNVILVIEVQGAMQIMNKIREAYLIFITTSSIDELGRRIEKRGAENTEEMRKRLEIARNELKFKKYYDCIIVNNNYNEALLNLKKVLDT
ncbi:MAG: guanylate kinase [Actinobacteria bacterium RBG_19FT_COMBO_36_27]|nr:MAG: guanylate kinase [Actinobacteria bacterium RBG_19FT_COMBO_36_27]